MKKILFFLFLCPYLASATVVTGNSNPGSFYSGNQAVFDFDNNGVFDLSVKHINLGNWNYTLLLKGLNGTKVETDGNLNLIGYNPGTPLGVNTYQDSGYVKSPYYTNGTREKFAGFKFKIGSNYCCGYVNIEAYDGGSSSFFMKKFGYETNSSICIKADADWSLGVDDAESDNSNLIVSPNPSNGKFDFLLEGLTLANDCKMEVYNMQIEKIYQTTITNSKFDIDLTNRTDGIYFIRIYNGQAILTKKIVIQH
jgi:hypothetical protein